MAEFFLIDVLKSKKNLLKNVWEKQGRCAQNQIKIVLKIREKIKHTNCSAVDRSTSI